MLRVRFVVLLVCASLAACDSGGDRLLEIDGSGVVRGTVVRDTDASGDIGAGDEPAANVPVALVLAGTADTVARASTNSAGLFSLPEVPVGRYEVVLAGGALGDTLIVVRRDPAPSSGDPSDPSVVTLGVGDTLDVEIALAYPTTSVAAARSLEVGRRVFVRAIATTDVAGAVPGQIFIQDRTGAIRVAASAASGVVPGDSVRVFGTTGVRDGQPILLNATAVTEAGGIPVDTMRVAAGTARSADDGRLDARLVLVREVFVTDTSSASGLFIMTVEDPSGSLRVAIPADERRPQYVPGRELDVTGVLAPRTGVQRTWELRPRSQADIVTGPL